MIAFTKSDPSIDREKAIKQLCERYSLLEFVVARMIIGQRIRIKIESQIAELMKILAEKQKEYDKLTDHKLAEQQRVINDRVVVNEEVSVLRRAQFTPLGCELDIIIVLFALIYDSCS
jgi:phosphoribosylformylglycinamidine (FGAM) synthase-like enzyme